MGMKRREVVAALGGGLGLARLGGRVGLDRLDRIGIQLYTVRDLVRQDLEGTLVALKEIGFAEVEFAGYPAGASAAQVRAMLARAGLDAPSGHFGLEQVRDAWEQTADFARGVGHRFVVVPSLPASDRQTLEGYRRVAELLSRRGEDARRRGMTLAYHNHDFEFLVMEGRTPFNVLLEESDPDLLKVELDLYWVTRGGRDPLRYFAQWPGRFPLLHVKDMDRAAERGFTEVGTGRIDFARIFRQAGGAGTRHFFYEQDRTAGPPLQSARASYQYLRQLTF
jgi:sugar phosphate isomerase/epimerase